MRRRVLVLVTVPVLVLTFAGPASATDHGQPPLAHRPLYLALGDSVAAGVGASDPAVTAYVPLFHDLLREELACRHSGKPGCRKLALRNLAKGGATSASLIDTQLRVAVAELHARNHDRHARNDVRVITIDIGGNDVFDAVPSCTAGPTPECLRLIQTTLQAFARNFSRILGGLRAAAGQDTAIIAMTYYNPLPSCHLSALASLADNVLEGGPGFDGRLNDLIRLISAENGVAVADTYGKLAARDLVGGTDCLHPDDSGHRIIADVFAAALAGTEARAA
jgi:lysophospholipase L1-like esterase